MDLEVAFDYFREAYSLVAGPFLKILRALQLIFFGMIILAGVLGIGWASIWWYQDESIPQYIIQAGPILLVLVTLINIGLAGFGYLESRRERRIARESLDLHRQDIKLKKKPAIIDTIAFSIDPTLDRLQDDQSMLSHHIEYVEYHRLSEFDLIDKEMLQDIPDRYPDLHLDIPAYLSIRNAYDEKRDCLQRQLEEAVPGELDNDTADSLLTATGSSLDEIGGEEDVYWQRLEEYSSDLAVVALTGKPPSSTKGWIADNAEAIQEALLELRNTDLLGDEFDELEKIRKDLSDENMRIFKNLETAKNSLKDEYGIRESEIVKRKGEVG